MSPGLVFEFSVKHNLENRGEVKASSGDTTNLSKSILKAKIPKAIGKAANKCPALGYSTPGAGSARSAQVTLCGSQNLSFQNQAERAAMFRCVPPPYGAVDYFLTRKKNVERGTFSPFASPADLQCDLFPHSTLPHYLE